MHTNQLVSISSHRIPLITKKSQQQSARGLDSFDEFSFNKGHQANFFFIYFEKNDENAINMLIWCSIDFMDLHYDIRS